MLPSLHSYSAFAETDNLVGLLSHHDGVLLAGMPPWSIHFLICPLTDASFSLRLTGQEAQ